MLPDWLKEPTTVNAPKTSRRHRSFWRRTLSALAETLKKEMVAQESAERPGFLQRIDPRAKLVAAAMIVVSLTFVHSPSVLAGVIAASAALGVLSKVDIRTFGKTLVPAFLLTLVLAAPSAFGVITPGRAVLAIGPVSVTDNGMVVAARFLLGALACVSVASLVMLTTRWPSLLAALRAFRVPRVFILTLLMTYRYLFVLVRNAEEMHLAKESRTIVAGPMRWERRWVADRAGDLFVRARRLSEQVYLAMTARGFTGEARSLAGAELLHHRGCGGTQRSTEGESNQ